MRKDINIQELIADYQNISLTVTEILSKHKSSNWFLFNVLQKNNIPHRLKISGITSKNIDNNFIVASYNNGENIQNIARTIGCSAILIKKCLIKNNIEIRGSFTRLTEEKIDKRLRNNNINRLSPFIGSSDIIKLQCDVCKYIWEREANRNNGCPECAGNAPLTNEKIDKILENRSFKRVDNYIDRKTRLEFQCNIINCKTSWMAYIGCIIGSKTGCPQCGGKLPLTNEIIDERLIKDNRPIKRIGNYVNAKTPLSFQCDYCLLKWDAATSNILGKNKRGCPNCPLGKNEKMIGQIFSDLNLTFEPQKKIKVLIPSETSRIQVDFYFPGANIIVEYNGRQHYEAVCFGSMTQEEADFAFQNQQKRDLRLQKLCDDNGIVLIWIDGREYKGDKLKNYLVHTIIPQVAKIAA